MKWMNTLLVVLLATTCLFAVACDDDEESGSAACTDYAQELADIECLSIFTQDEVKQICDASVKDGNCGSEYEDYIECANGASMTCGEYGGAEFDGCDEEYTVYSECASSNE